MAFDLDHSFPGPVFEYNASRDNEGGFLLFYPYDKLTTNSTIRYNLSIKNKAMGILFCVLWKVGKLTEILSTSETGLSPTLSKK